MKHEFSCVGGRVDIFGEAVKANFLRLEFADYLYEMLEAWGIGSNGTENRDKPQDPLCPVTPPLFPRSFRPSSRRLPSGPTCR